MLPWLRQNYDWLQEDHAAATVAAYSANNNYVKVVVNNANSLPCTLSTKIPHVCNLLGHADNNKLEDVCTMLANANWLRTGKNFVSLERAAFVSLVQAELLLVAMPPDAACF